jgi:hypothetical protein
MDDNGYEPWIVYWFKMNTFDIEVVVDWILLDVFWMKLFFECVLVLEVIIIIKL